MSQTELPPEPRGKNFLERRQVALEAEARQADTETPRATILAELVGKTILMSFRPSTVLRRGVPIPELVYSPNDKLRIPLGHVVTLREISDDSSHILVSQGELHDNSYDQQWEVRLDDILDVQLIDDSESTTPQEP